MLLINFMLTRYAICVISSNTAANHVLKEQLTVMLFKSISADTKAIGKLFIGPSFQGVNRRFMLPFGNTAQMKDTFNQLKKQKTVML